MRVRTMSMMVALVALVLTSGVGCVTKKAFRTETEQANTRVSSVESAVEANERRIGDLKSETDQKIAALEADTAAAAEIGMAAQAEAVAAGELAAKAERGRLLWSVKLSNDDVTFNFGQAGVADEAKPVLDDLARKVKSYNRAVYIEIEGHTDNVGDEGYNMELGEKRAKAVRNYLNEEGGIPLHAMNTISYGETRPEADNSTAEGRASNRRVVIRVLE